MPHHVEPTNDCSVTDPGGRGPTPVPAPLNPELSALKAPRFLQRPLIKPASDSDCANRDNHGGGASDNISGASHNMGAVSDYYGGGKSDCSSRNGVNGVGSVTPHRGECGPGGQTTPIQQLLQQGALASDPGPRGGGSRFKGFFKKLTRSGSSASKGEGSPPLGASPGGSPAPRDPSKEFFFDKVNILKWEDGMRPRSSSDASRFQRPKMRKLRASDSTIPRTPRLSPHLSPGNGGGPRHPPTSSIGPLEFVEMYRERAYSESKNDATRLQAIAAIRARRTKSTDVPGAGAPSAARGAGAGAGGALSPLCAAGDGTEPHIIIWSDPETGTQVFRLPKIDLDSDNTGRGESDGGVGAVDKGRLAVRGAAGGVEGGGGVGRGNGSVFARVLGSLQCYDIVPPSCKVVMLDAELVAHFALDALLTNNLRSALVWDSRRHAVIGMLTVTDFIRVLLRFHATAPDSLDQIETKTLSSLRRIIGYKPLPRGNVKSALPAPAPIISLPPDASLLDAARLFRTHRVHRLPLLDPVTGDVLCCVSKTALLRVLRGAALSLADPQQCGVLARPVGALDVGTYENVATVTEGASLLAALAAMLDHGISTLPVIDSQRRPVGVYTRAAALGLAADRLSAVRGLTVGGAIDRGGGGCRRFETCRKGDALGAVLGRMVEGGVRCLVVVDGEGRVDGIVSQSDVLYRLALEGGGEA